MLDLDQKHKAILKKSVQKSLNFLQLSNSLKADLDKIKSDLLCFYRNIDNMFNKIHINLSKVLKMQKTPNFETFKKTENLPLRKILLKVLPAEIIDKEVHEKEFDFEKLLNNYLFLQSVEKLNYIPKPEVQYMVVFGQYKLITKYFIGICEDLFWYYKKTTEKPLSEEKFFDKRASKDLQKDFYTKINHLFNRGSLTDAEVQNLQRNMKKSPPKPCILSPSKSSLEDSPLTETRYLPSEPSTFELQMQKHLKKRKSVSKPQKKQQKSYSSLNRKSSLSQQTSKPLSLSRNSRNPLKSKSKSPNPFRS